MDSGGRHQTVREINIDKGYRPKKLKGTLYLLNSAKITWVCDFLWRHWDKNN